jgi:hypothetical protein
MRENTNIFTHTHAHSLSSLVHVLEKVGGVSVKV